MAKGLTRRISIAVDPDLERVYRDAAAAVDMEFTVWIREWLRLGVPTMQAIIESKQLGGVSPLQAFMRSALLEGQRKVAGFQEETAPKGETA